MAAARTRPLRLGSTTIRWVRLPVPCAAQPWLSLLLVTCDLWTGAFDRWFEGCNYQNGRFYDNNAQGCEWPWRARETDNGTASKCWTNTSPKTVGAGYVTAELGNRCVFFLIGLVLSIVVLMIGQKPD